VLGLEGVTCFQGEFKQWTLEKKPNLHLLFFIQNQITYSSPGFCDGLWCDQGFSLLKPFLALAVMMRIHFISVSSRVLWA
jgi:hypothetical protein